MKKKLILDLSSVSTETLRALEEVLLIELSTLRESVQTESAMYSQLVVELTKLEVYLAAN